MKKLISILGLSLLSYLSVAQVTHWYFSTTDDLIAHLKRPEPPNTFSDNVNYDKSGSIVSVLLPPDCCTDRNIELLSQINSLRHLLICCGGHASTNAISALAAYPNLTGLGFVCCGGWSHDLIRGLPCLTNLQTLYLAQNSYWTNDTLFLAKMTNLVALEIAGSIPKTRNELLALTNLVNLRKLVIAGNPEYLKKMDTNIFSALPKLTTLVLTSDIDNPAMKEPVWKMLVGK